mmetsp:Transcript_18507/g.16385  ORF Transcript_18507/g.16385 Transcript_18507/m.16385 type:complete len:97 (-) Transcript_18507:317-607(-)
MLKSEPEKVRYAMMNQCKENVSPYSRERVGFIKELFEQILDNLLPSDYRATCVVFDYVSISKWLRIQKTSQQKYLKGEKEVNERSVSDKVMCCLNE